MNSAILLFTKIPSLTPCKTRLEQSSCLTKKECASLQLAFLVDILNSISHYKLAIATAPPILLSQLSELSDSFPDLSKAKLFAQEDLPFAERLQAAAERAHQLFDSGILILGSDAPLIPDSTIQEALQCLDEGKAALGPTNGGGLYLIGIPRGFFKNQGKIAQAFSGRKVSELAALTACFGAQAIKTKLLAPDIDIDIEEDLVYLHSVLGARSSGAETLHQASAKHTAAYLDSLSLELESDPEDSRRVRLIKNLQVVTE